MQGLSKLIIGDFIFLKMTDLIIIDSDLSFLEFLILQKEYFKYSIKIKLFFNLFNIR